MGEGAGGPCLILPIEALLQLKMLAGLAGQVHPLPFEPFDGGFAQEVLGLHLGNERDVSPWWTQRVSNVTRR